MYPIAYWMSLLGLFLDNLTLTLVQQIIMLYQSYWELSSDILGEYTEVMNALYVYLMSASTSNFQD